MKFTKKYLPSLGFTILLITIISSALLLRWVLEPLSYQKAMALELKGHELTREGKYKKASYYFLKAASIKDDNISRSRRYRCAGTTAQNPADKKAYFKLALKYNKNNQNAKNALKLLQKTKR